jgi:hypothetical protein
VAKPAAPRNGRARLLARDVEQLTVQAMQLGVSLEELQSAFAECWRRLAGGIAHDPYRTPDQT